MRGPSRSERHEDTVSSDSSSFVVVVQAVGRGEDVTDDVPPELLPHSDTADNRQRGAWSVHSRVPRRE